MIQRVRDGELLTAVARDYGLTRERVRQITTVAGVFSRGSIYHCRKRREIIRELWELGYTNVEITEELSVSKVTVRRDLRLLGLKANAYCVDCGDPLEGRTPSTQRCDICQAVHIRKVTRETARRLYKQRRKDPAYRKMNRETCKAYYRKVRSGYRARPAARCDFCDHRIPEDAHANRKYCDFKCRRLALTERLRKKKG